MALLGPAKGAVISYEQPNRAKRYTVALSSARRSALGVRGVGGRRALGPETIMMKNGLYSLAAVAIDGVDVEVGGVLILQDGKMLGGDSYVYLYRDL